MTAEKLRLDQARRREQHWKRWGPYLSERQWGTVREDYSAGGNAWDYFPHEHARSRAYRWGEDGLLGISDNHQRLCFAVGLWNGHDHILKERLFGVSNSEGIHGEDVKELYYYLDSTPTHSYMRALYKYPQAAFPYEWLVDANRGRSRSEPEPELRDSGVFNGSRYWDVFVEYAKAGPNDILIRVTVFNRGPEPASLHVLPQLWFRNRWSWGRPNRPRPEMWQAAPNCVLMRERQLGEWRFWLDNPPEILFTHNETNPALWDMPASGHFKDAFHRRIIGGETGAVNPNQTGTKTCGWYQLHLDPGRRAVIRCRLTEGGAVEHDGDEFDEIFAQRRFEADEFYSELQGCGCELSEDGRNVQRQAFAGLLWTKQFYRYTVEEWIKGDPAGPAPPPERREGRNKAWVHFFADDILSMPDKWEYPWFAAWDLAFHMIPFALIDPDFAKHQLQLLLREWYLHPNGQVPAYEWAFDDVNPPVHAWAVWRVYKIDARHNGAPDRAFLERCFHKLLMNFTWWVNRKDSLGDNIFEGGFLGLDNIGVFDRSKPLPTGGFIEQSDGTSWMAMYSLNMLRIAVELAQEDSVYEDIASKFLEHFLYIADSMNNLGGTGLWDEEDGFFYDRLRLPDGHSIPLRVRSLVGLAPLFAVESIDMEDLAPMHGFRRRAAWFISHRPDLCTGLTLPDADSGETRGLLSLISRGRLERVIEAMFDETEFLSDYGIRSLSRIHRDKPYVFQSDGVESRVAYQPGDSDTWMFGGNSNWRGPIWFPMNYLFIESLQKYHHYFGDSVTVEFPRGSGRRIHLGEAAAELSRRLSRLFLRDADGRRACNGDVELFQSDPHFRDCLLFHEYFHGDTGRGLGANHQTGWTALVAKLLFQSGE